MYGTNDSSIEPGDVVSIDPALNAGVRKSQAAYEQGVLGIVSTRPALLMGGADSEGITKVPVALAGRVPVKVSTENGPIRPGDFLTSGSIPGVAMKSTKAGPVIGQALTSYDGVGVGTVLVFIKNTYYSGSAEPLLTGEASTSSSSQTVTSAALGSINDFFLAYVLAPLKNLGITIEQNLIKVSRLIVEDLLARKITVKRLEILEKIQVRDQVTGSMWCTWLANGEWVKVESPCDETAPVESPVVLTPQISVNDPLGPISPISPIESPSPSPTPPQPSPYQGEGEGGVTPEPIGPISPIESPSPSPTPPQPSPYQGEGEGGVTPEPIGPISPIESPSPTPEPSVTPESSISPSPLPTPTPVGIIESEPEVSS